MTIEILSVREFKQGFNVRIADIAIDDGGPAYHYIVGNLPPTGDLQPVLEARQAELFPLAEARGVVVAEQDTSVPRAKAWLAGEPAAVAFMRKSPAEQRDVIDSLSLTAMREVVWYLAVVASAMVRREFLE